MTRADMGRFSIPQETVPPNAIRGDGPTMAVNGQAASKARAVSSGPDGATLLKITSEWRPDMKARGIHAFSWRVKSLVDSLMEHVKSRMEENARSDGSTVEEGAGQEDRQHGFLRDDVVAREIDRFIQQGHPDIDICVSWQIMVFAMRGALTGQSHADDDSDDEDSDDTDGSVLPHATKDTLAPRLTTDLHPEPPSGSLVTRRDAYFGLFEAILKACPLLAFDKLPPKFLDLLCKRQKKHPTSTQESPAFYIAMENGADYLVHLMIQECLRHIAESMNSSHPVRLQGVVSSPRQYLTRVMKEEHFRLTTIEHAIDNYRVSSDKKHLDVLETLLNFDKSNDGTDRLVDVGTLRSVVQQTFLACSAIGGTGRVGDVSENGTARKAAPGPEEPTLATVKMILRYRSDLKKKQAIIEILEWPESKNKPADKTDTRNTTWSKTERLTKAGLVAAMVDGAEGEIDEQVAQLVIERNLVEVWNLEPFQRAVGHLLANEKTAQDLFCAALARRNEFCFLESIAPRVGPVLEFGLLGEIVKCGHLRAWKFEPIQKRWQQIKKKDPGLQMLHVAVQYQQVEFVRHFLREEPEAATQPVPVIGLTNTNAYPLWHNNFTVCSANEEGGLQKKRRDFPKRPVSVGSRPSSSFTQKDVVGLIEAETESNVISSLAALAPGTQSSGPAAQRVSSNATSSETVTQDVVPTATPDADRNAEIRRMLVHSTIEQAREMSTVAKIFRESEEPVGQICFDLSRFASRLYSVDEFVRSLLGVSGQHSERHLKFEDILRYADFPALDLDVWDKSPEWRPRVHDEVFRALRWLHLRGVRKIMRLKVLDRMNSPHDEERIAEVVGEFEVAALDWRHLDMALSYFNRKTKRRLTDLHLYSSGKTAVVDHWLSAKGIKSLKNIKSVTIHMIQDLMTTDRRKTLRKRIVRVLKALRMKRPGFNFTVVSQSWNSLPPNGGKDLLEIAERAVPQLFPYITNYRHKVPAVLSAKEKFQPTRVAILDNGILNIPPARTGKEDEGLWPRIADGQSFVDNVSRLGSWLFASDPHGTQMANLICAIDPYCELYVAKIVEGRQGILPDSVAEAIHWAISKKVDIISMSFAIPDNGNSDEYSRSLQLAVQKANRKGIIQFCSHHDEGWNVHQSWPMACDETLVVVACNEFGGFPDRHASEYDYKIHGIDISAGAVPYLESKDTVSGSSVATAIVAGLASLMLSCRRIQFPEPEVGRREGYVTSPMFVGNMLKKISDPTSQKNSKQRYVQLKKFEEFLKDKDQKMIYPWLRA